MTAWQTTRQEVTAPRKYGSAALGHHWVCEPLPHSGCSVPSKIHPHLTLHHRGHWVVPKAWPPGHLPELSSAAPPGVRGGEWPVPFRQGAGARPVSGPGPWGGQGSPNSARVTSQDPSRAAFHTPPATFKTGFNEHTTAQLLLFTKRDPQERVPEPGARRASPLLPALPEQEVLTLPSPHTRVHRSPAQGPGISHPDTPPSLTPSFLLIGGFSTLARSPQDSLVYP